MPGAAWDFAWFDNRWPSSRRSTGSSFFEVREPEIKGKTVKVPERVVALSSKIHPLKSGILALSQRHGAVRPHGTSRHKSVGLLASPGQHAHAPYGGDYGSYDPYAGGYDPYAGNYDPYDGGYHEYAPEDDYAPVDYGGEMEEPPPPAIPMPEGEVEALKAEQMQDAALKQCMAKCPIWDPLATAKPEDLQHASLVVLQRLARPERRIAPSLRRASAAVDAAGRSFERWVRKRQDLGRELPKLRKIIMGCKTLQDEQDAQEVDNDLEAIRAETDRARQQVQKNASEAELAQESIVMQDVGHMQGKADRWALEQEMQQQDRRDALVDSQAMQQVNGYNQQGADFQQRQMEEVTKEMKQLPSSSLELKASKDASRGAPTSLQSLAKSIDLEGPEGQNPTQQSHHHHHHHHHGGAHEAWHNHCDDGGCYDEYGGYWDDIHGGYWDEYGRYWEEGWGGYWDPDGTYYVKDDAQEAKEDASSLQEWFKQCGQIRIPPSIVATRRAASEAYWDFDRSLAVAEKAVDDALTSARMKGE
ncbi:unnamed protein product [Durusdinium trenchii]|uniref:Uncharacterized protein n=1 Tax=Durusdinium trenchii TaxID=1381693 RepID=A0ABP0NGA9_9DINO